jgi:hypothetical protein
VLYEESSSYNIVSFSGKHKTIETAKTQWLEKRGEDDRRKQNF